MSRIIVRREPKSAVCGWDRQTQNYFLDFDDTETGEVLWESDLRVPLHPQVMRELFDEHGVEWPDSLMGVLIEHRTENVGNVVVEL